MAAMLRRAADRLFQQPYLLLAITYFLWSINIVLGRYAVGHIPPMAFSLFRWVVAFAMILPFAWPHLKRDWPAIRAHFPLMTLLAITGTSGYSVLAYWGLQYTEAINALLIQSAVPVMVAVFSFILLGDRLSAKQIVGLVLSMAGILFILSRGDLDVLHAIAFNLGDLWFFVAISVIAFYSALLRKGPRLHPLSLLAFTMGWGAVWNIPLYVWEEASGRHIVFDVTTILVILYVALFATIVAYLCYNRGIALIGANRSAAMYPSIVAFGAVFAIFFLGETPRFYHLAGCLLILCGIIIATRQKRETTMIRPSERLR